MLGARRRLRRSLPGELSRDRRAPPGARLRPREAPMPRAMPYLLLLPATLFLCVFFLYPVRAGGLARRLTRDGGLDRRELPAHGVALEVRPALSQHPAPRRRRRPDPARAGARHGAHRHAGSSAGRSAILYIFAIPLGISDLAAGLIWLAIFEQSGFLNSALFGLGVIERPILFLGYQNAWIIFLAIVARRDLAGDGDHDGDPRRRHGADPEGVRRGGRGLRRLALAALRQGHAAAAAAEPADRADPAHHPRLRGLRRRHRARRHQLPGADGRDLRVAVRAAGPRRRRRLRDGDPRHLDRLHAS